MTENNAPKTPETPEVEDDGLGEFTMELTHKPVGGVTPGKVPTRVAEMLAVQAPKALADPDYDLTVNAKDEAAAKKIVAWARAWGAQQDPKLYITKLPNRKDMTNNVARLSVKKDADVSAENRPGRRNR